MNLRVNQLFSDPTQIQFVCTGCDTEPWGVTEVPPPAFAAIDLERSNARER
jgi:hypothetical protein